jgi:hypothetical protein
VTVMPTERPPGSLAPRTCRPVPLDEFGALLLAEAVTPERVTDIVRRLVGDELRIGPSSVGPGGIASATTRGRLGPLRCGRLAGDPCLVLIWAPVALAISLDLGLRKVSFLAHVCLRLHVRTRPCAPLSITVDIDAPTEGDVAVRLFTPGTVGKYLVRVGGVEQEINRQVREHVQTMLSSPEARHYTWIDLPELIQLAWSENLARAGTGPTSRLRRDAEIGAPERTASARDAR